MFRFLSHLVDEGLLLCFGLRLNGLLELRGLLTHHAHLGPHCANLSSALLEDLRCDSFRRLGAGISVDGLGTSDVGVMSSSACDVLRVVDFFTSRSYHVGHVRTQILDMLPMLAKLGLSEDK